MFTGKLDGIDFGLVLGDFNIRQVINGLFVEDIGGNSINMLTRLSILRLWLFILAKIIDGFVWLWNFRKYLGDIVFIDC